VERNLGSVFLTGGSSRSRRGTPACLSNSLPPSPVVRQPPQRGTPPLHPQGPHPRAEQHAARRPLLDHEPSPRLAPPVLSFLRAPFARSSCLSARPSPAQHAPSALGARSAQSPRRAIAFRRGYAPSARLRGSGRRTSPAPHAVRRGRRTSPATHAARHARGRRPRRETSPRPRALAIAEPRSAHHPATTRCLPVSDHCA
jgi:hypothetical protein